MWTRKCTYKGRGMHMGRDTFSVLAIMSYTSNFIILAVVVVLCNHVQAHPRSYYNPRPLSYPFGYSPHDYGHNLCSACGIATCAIVLQNNPQIYIGCVAGIRVTNKCEPGQLLDVTSFQCKNVTGADTPAGNSTADDGEDDMLNIGRESTEPQLQMTASNMKVIIEKLNSLQESLTTQQERHKEDMIVLTKALSHTDTHTDGKTKDPLVGVAANDRDDDAVNEVVSRLTDNETTIATTATIIPTLETDLPPNPQDMERQQKLRQLETMLSFLGLGSANRTDTLSDEAQNDEEEQREMRRRIMKMLLKK